MKASLFSHTASELETAQLWHYHEEVEFIFVMEGKKEIHTPTRTYRLSAGDVLVIGASQLHRTTYYLGERVKFLVVHVEFEQYFDPATMLYARHFLEMVHPLEALNYIFEQSRRTRTEAAETLLKIYEEIMRQRKGYEIAVSMHVKQLLLLLLRNDDQDVLQGFDHADAGLVRAVDKYVEQHLNAKIEMNEVSQLVGMSYGYFSKYFKQKTGVSFVDFVNRKRVAKAERLLAVSNLSVTEIAVAVGIENMAHFYELFKRYLGSTPKQYKSRMAVHGRTDPDEISGQT